MTVKYKVDDRSVMLLTTASKVSKIEAHESFRLGLKKVMYSRPGQVVLLSGKLLFMLSCPIGKGRDMPTKAKISW